VAHKIRKQGPEEDGNDADVNKPSVKARPFGAGANGGKLGKRCGRALAGGTAIPRRGCRRMPVRHEEFANEFGTTPHMEQAPQTVLTNP